MEAVPAQTPEARALDPGQDQDADSAPVAAWPSPGDVAAEDSRLTLKFMTEAETVRPTKISPRLRWAA